MNLRKIVLIYSVPRSGSVLIRNIVKDLFGEENIEYTHGFQVTHQYVIIPYRDFRDCMVSWRRWRSKLSKKGEGIETKPMSLLEIFKYILWVKKWIKELEKWERSKRRVLYLKYERFKDNFDYIFDSFEDYFSLRIAKKQREELKEKYSFEKLKVISDILRNCNEGDVNTLISGKHLYKGEIGAWKKIIPRRYHYFTYLCLRKSLLKYGYGMSNTTWKRLNISQLGYIRKPITKKNNEK